jgi:hypothetical protein
MAVVFLEGGLSPVPMRMASTDSIVDPAAGYVNSRIVQREDSQIPKRTSLLNIAFLPRATPCD